MRYSSACARRDDHVDREHDVLNAKRNQRAEEWPQKKECETQRRKAFPETASGVS
jgi:hypothetical protein